MPDDPSDESTPAMHDPEPIDEVACEVATMACEALILHAHMVPDPELTVEYVHDTVQNEIDFVMRLIHHFDPAESNHGACIRSYLLENLPEGYDI